MSALGFLALQVHLAPPLGFDRFSWSLKRRFGPPLGSFPSDLLLRAQLCDVVLRIGRPNIVGVRMYTRCWEIAVPDAKSETRIKWRWAFRQ